MKAPLPDNEAERLAALRRFDVLDSEAEEAFDEVARLAAAILDVPVALISLVDEARQWFKSRVGLDVTETPRDAAFCAHAILDPEVLVVPDARLDPRFAANPLVLESPGIRFYAGAPLTTAKGIHLGTLCVIDRKPRELSSRDRDTLRTLSRQVVLQLELRLALRQARSAEGLLHSVLSQLWDVYFHVDIAGTLLAVSPSIARHGYAPAELLGCDVGLMYADPAERNSVVAAMLEQGELDDFEVRLRRRNGQIAVASASARLIRNERGEPTGVADLLRDISARKELERQRADMVAMVTHDIRNPVANILGFAEILAAGKLAGEDREHLSGIARNAKNLAFLAENFLTVSAIESGGTSVTKRPVQIRALLEQACETARNRVKRANVTIECRVPSDLQVIAADPVALERVFSNLIHNAAKYSHDGGRVLVLCESRGHEVAIAVADSGIGMSAEEIPMLFQRYRRTAGSAAIAGTGLGLFIVKSLVEAHGGRVEVESRPGDGSTFTVALPA